MSSILSMSSDGDNLQTTSSSTKSLQQLQASSTEFEIITETDDDDDDYTLVSSFDDNTTEYLDFGIFIGYFLIRHQNCNFAVLYSN